MEATFSDCEQNRREIVDKHMNKLDQKLIEFDKKCKTSNKKETKRNANWINIIEHLRDELSTVRKELEDEKQMVRLLKAVLRDSGLMYNESCEEPAKNPAIDLPNVKQEAEISIVDNDGYLEVEFDQENDCEIPASAKDNVVEIGECNEESQMTRRSQMSSKKATSPPATGSKLKNRSFKCELCPRSFIRKSQLKNHQPIHTQEQPFHCVECGKRFKRFNHLVRHEAIHSGVKRFKCKLCGNKFYRSDYLKVHLRKHTGERP